VSDGQGRVSRIATLNGLEFSGFRTRSNGEILHTCPDRPRGSCSLLCYGYWVSFLGAEQRWCGVEHQPFSSTDNKEWVELYLYSLYLPLSLVKHCRPVMADGFRGCFLVVEHPFLVIVSYRHVTSTPFHIEM